MQGDMLDRERYPASGGGLLGMDPFRFRLPRAFKIMLDERHWIVRFLGAHLLHSWTEARNGKDDDIAHLLGRLHASESLPRDILPIHLVIRRVVQITENRIGPDRRAGEFHDGFIELLVF